jgi:hypothetical protein
MDYKQSDDAAINQAENHLDSAAAKVKEFLRDKLSAKDAKQLPRTRPAAMRLLEEGIRVITLHPELAVAGYTAPSLERMYSRYQRMQHLGWHAEYLAARLRDTLRVDEVVLYKAVMAAYQLGELTGRDKATEDFVKKMKKALALGPRVKPGKAADRNYLIKFFEAATRSSIRRGSYVFGERGRAFARPWSSLRWGTCPRRAWP